MCNLGVIARTMELFCFRMSENSTDTTAEVLDSVRCESNGIGFEIPWAFQRDSKNWACVKMEHRISTTFNSRIKINTCFLKILRLRPTLSNLPTELAM